MANLNNVETEDKILNPEEKLWKAVFKQGVEDSLGKFTIPMNRRERQEAKFWVNSYNEDFIIVCENAGVDPKHAARKIKHYEMIQRMQRKI
jgi:hypothetical protein